MRYFLYVFFVTVSIAFACVTVYSWKIAAIFAFITLGALYGFVVVENEKTAQLTAMFHFLYATMCLLTGAVVAMFYNAIIYFI